MHDVRLAAALGFPAGVAAPTFVRDRAPPAPIIGAGSVAHGTIVAFPTAAF